MRTKIAINLLAIISLVFLNCTQTATDLMIQKELNNNWTLSQPGKNEWLPAKVPGTVHTDLLDNGKIEDLFYRLNERDLQWIDKFDRENKTTFSISKEILQKDVVGLDFKGLDTYAAVSVNGAKALSDVNMFREWKADVNGFLREGENEMYILLKAWDKAKIEKLHIIQNTVTKKKAAFTAAFEINCVTSGKANLSVFNGDTALVSNLVDLKEGIEKYSVDFEIKNPKPWWTNGFGEPHLYHLTGKLNVGGGVA